MRLSERCPAKCYKCEGKPKFHKSSSALNGGIGRGPVWHCPQCKSKVFLEDFLAEILIDLAGIGLVILGIFFSLRLILWSLK